MVWKNLALHGLAVANRQNMTDAECMMWSCLRRIKNLHFRRQQTIGNYIVDFVSLNEKIIIECDGSQHFNDKPLEYDHRRTEYLESVGFRVLRFRNYEILKNPKRVMDIVEAFWLDKLQPSMYIENSD